MTNQEEMQLLLNRSALHIRTQGAKATTRNGNYDQCCYRTPDGNQCAAGIFITDYSKLDSESMFFAFGKLCELYGESAIEPLAIKHVDFVAKVLQKAHDSTMMFVGATFLQSYEERLAKLVDQWNVDNMMSLVIPSKA